MRGRALLERRSKMLRQIGLGVELSIVVSDFSREYGVTQNAIYKDWEQREKWAGDVAQLEDPEAMVAELIHFLKWLKRRSVLEVLKGDSSSNRIGAIKTAESIASRIFDIARATGKIATVADQVEHKGTIIITGWSLGTTDDNGELHPTSRSETVP